MRGKLFTLDFLDEGVRETGAWKELETGEVERFEEALGRIFGAFPVGGSPNEATTEQDLIFPILEALGWDHYLPQQTTSGRGRRDVPDVLLFPDGDAKTDAQEEADEADRYRYGLAVLEAKRWERPLDRAEERRGAPTRLPENAPSTQMLRYLSRADVASNGKVQWGILTNGRSWRLYWQGARSRSEEFLELDLAVLAGAPGIQAELISQESEHRAHFLRAFYLLFRREAFLPQPEDPEGRTFHRLALDESRRWEEKVSTELGGLVFQTVFPNLLASLLEHDPEAPDAPTAEYLEELRRAGLTFLYRLLFVLYAEDRNLLPTHDSRYDDYSLRKIRDDLQERLDRRDAFSERASNIYLGLQELFGAVAEGDPGIGLPPYDGGLFESGRHPLLERVRLPDAELAPLLDALSRRDEGGERRWINYRDLSVQHLGSIYERLLEFQPLLDEKGDLRLRPAIFARKTSGSYYTHDDLVQLILRRTVGPLVDGIEKEFNDANRRLASDSRSKSQRLDELRRLDPASRILDLKVCDPAMGSGHFLVSLVDFLADRVLLAMAHVETEVHWAPEEESYHSPLADRIETIREKILSNAAADDWRVDLGELDDRHIVRRIILKRVVYGVDKNLMAVELAKVALWLHTFTTGAPLSFLDHHLRCGDSLYGEWLDDVSEALEQEVGPLFMGSVRASIAQAAKTMEEVARISDDDVAEVKQSRRFFRQAEETLQPLRRLLDLWHARRWLQSAGGKKQKGELDGLSPLLGTAASDLLEVLDAGRVLRTDAMKDKDRQAVDRLLAEVRALADRERFLHWELAFPTVWKDIGNSGRRGGFDAVLGNPPWDRLKLQQVEWFAAREPDIARSARAADRKNKILGLEKRKAPLWDDYRKARDAAETAARVARDCGNFPLLASGDINIYSLFVERAQDLVQPQGLIGLLVPSGIASDKTASEFFRGISTSGRLGALFDFENKKVFFPDVDSRFKFSAFVFGGSKRRFKKAECAFFLHSVDELDEPGRSFPLGPDDFEAVNPNTGTAPIFRSRRDAEITTGIYQRLPVLVDRRGKKVRKAWPVEYVRMFDMTNDSDLFKTREELEAEGFYPVAGNQWKKGEEVVLPLYEGKMVQMYDHRAASVMMNPENLHRPAQPLPATDEEHRDPEWLPEPRYWVPDVEVPDALGIQWTIGFKDITSPTNARTMIAAALPAVAFGNKVPILRPAAKTRRDEYVRKAPLLLANLNSFVFDFVARQKVHGQTVNLFILEQLPVLPPSTFDREAGDGSLADFVRQEVLRLTYTAVDMKPFARDLGYEGAPSPWDREDRRHRTARLDALFFHLYGVDRSEADYILNQFLGVREHDEQQFGGRFLTRDLILAYMNAIDAGDLDSVVKVS